MNEQTTNGLGAEILSKAKVTLVFTGYGFLTVTDKAVIWNKSASSYFAFGLATVATKDHLYLPLNNIAQVSTYTYFPGGGLVLTTTEGKIYKIAFKKKKDFVIAHEYLSNAVK
ncbi:MAG: hypothetical protein E7530_02095 [Ruminococcaceae bacterium]|nr:hypothetical protein [Oscillospiraceae bacterium]